MPKESNNDWFFIFGVLIVIYLMRYKKIEKMSNSETKKNKYCSQKSINNAYNYWIFGTPKFVR